jgi:hypothetical protein
MEGRSYLWLLVEVNTPDRHAQLGEMICPTLVAVLVHRRLQGLVGGRTFALAAQISCGLLPWIIHGRHRCFIDAPKSPAAREGRR